MIIIKSIPCYLKNYFVGFSPSSWRFTHYSSWINIFSFHSFRRNLKSCWRKFAHEFFWISNICKLITFNINFFTACNWSHIRINICHNWFIIVWKCETCCTPINTIQAYFESKFRNSVWVLWSFTNYSNGGIKICSYNIVSKFTMRYYSIFWHIFEPNTYNLN